MARAKNKRGERERRLHEMDADEIEALLDGASSLSLETEGDADEPQSVGDAVRALDAAHARPAPRPTVRCTSEDSGTFGL